MPKGDKYLPLKHFLMNINQPIIKLTYQHIEQILGFNLPSSAYKHAEPWWSNHRGHSQAIAWLDAGFETDYVSDTSKEHTIVFVKRENSIA